VEVCRFVSIGVDDDCLANSVDTGVILLRSDRDSECSKPGITGVVVLGVDLLNTLKIASMVGFSIVINDFMIGGWLIRGVELFGESFLLRREAVFEGGIGEKMDLGSMIGEALSSSRVAVCGVGVAIPSCDDGVSHGGVAVDVAQGKMALAEVVLAKASWIWAGRKVL